MTEAKLLKYRDIAGKRGVWQLYLQSGQPSDGPHGSVFVSDGKREWHGKFTGDAFTEPCYCCENRHTTYLFKPMPQFMPAHFAKGTELGELPQLGVRDYKVLLLCERR